MHASLQPHIRLRAGQVCPVVVAVGDPARAEWYATRLCEACELLTVNREYSSYRVTYRGQLLTIISHGVGAPGAAICFEELIRLGAKCIIRAGTCGSLNPDKVKTGDICIVHAAVKGDGFSNQFEAVSIPAVADWSVVSTLVESAKHHGVNTYPVLAVTTDVFYLSGPEHQRSEKYQKAGIDIQEMEMSALFTVCRHRGVKSGGLCSVGLGVDINASREQVTSEMEKTAIESQLLMGKVVGSPLLAFRRFHSQIVLDAAATFSERIEK